ncbi:hypothetical protein BKA66DRAFT_513521 [Pyrenochaeta sp. MPI-SDFR-AT-0127]|nr:hypothetical protein BKA66DRAFT_513521 [Pyrenochaeta sp. MPI-SDFR-AT-0127]
MGFAQYFQRTTPTSHTMNTSRNPTGVWPLFASNAVLTVLSLTNLALISSMVAWLLDQKHNVRSYRIEWPGNTAQLNVEPRNLWVDQGHESNGAAVYGFLLGIFGMITAWRLRRSERPLKSLTALAILQLLAILFTLSALIFVFVVTYQTTGQHIREPIASNNMGTNYPEFKWTPETWMKAVLNLPLADGAKRKQINDQVRNMVAWRWMLIPLLIADLGAFGLTVLAWLKQRRNSSIRANSADAMVEK